ncbi:Patatin-like [Thraustotheca clavata]|uniref:Patatin-like n=1 Tax=Thraustotheca clavata TaxID=74557 RepID=A0A1V9Z7V7_9STRA|nr:Patatin-like [Thraustotheca clavata]
MDCEDDYGVWKYAHSVALAIRKQFQFGPFSSRLNDYDYEDFNAVYTLPRPFNVQIVPSYPQYTTVQIGFGGCGGLYNYHLGIASILQKHFDLSNCVFSGASTLKSFFYGPNMELIKNANVKTFHGLRDWIPLTKQHLLTTLSPDAYAKVDKKLFVSTTKVPSLSNKLISSWTLNEDMVDSILATGHIPIYTNEIVKGFRGASYIEGSLFNNTPVLLGDEHPSKLFQIYHWRTVWPHWVLISPNMEWSTTQFNWGRQDAMQHIHEIKALLHYKQDKCL